MWVILDFKDYLPYNKFSPQEQGVVHYIRYVFEMLKLTLFLDLTLQ